MNKLSLSKKIEMLITMLGVLTLICIQFTTDSSVIALSTAILGIGYVLLVKYKNKYAMMIGAIQCLLYMTVAYQNKVFGDVILNTYNVLFLAYGWFSWSHSQANNTKIEVRKLDRKGILNLIIITFLWYSVLVIILTTLGSYNPPLDALNTTCSTIAMFLATNRYSEQWIFWNLTNISSLVLYTTLFLSGANVLPLVIMFGLYLINSIHATYLWYRK